MAMVALASTAVLGPAAVYHARKPTVVDVPAGSTFGGTERTRRCVVEGGSGGDAPGTDHAYDIGARVPPHGWRNTLFSVSRALRVACTGASTRTIGASVFTTATDATAGCKLATPVYVLKQQPNARATHVSRRRWARSG